jgi:hypothetical protein
LNFPEAVGNKEDKNYEKPIGRSFYLEIAEKRVGAEEVEGLVDNVGSLWVSY